MANEAENLVNSGLIAALPYGVPPAAVSQILESGGSYEDAMRRLEQYEEEAEESGLELDFDIDNLYDQYETISQINGTAPFPVRDDAEVAAIVDENPELLDMAELVAATIENPDDLDEFEMLVGDIDAAMSNLSDDVVDEILGAMDSKDSFVGLEKVITDIETSIEQMGSMGESLNNWVAEVDTILKPSIVLEASEYAVPKKSKPVKLQNMQYYDPDPVSTGTAPLGGWEDPDDYARSPWIDPGGDIGVTGDNKEIWDSMNPAQQKEILEVGWENYDWDNFWENRKIDFADADEVELPPGFDLDVYSDNWYNELSDIEKGKFEQYMFVESELDIDKGSDWKGMIERGTSPDLDLSLTMSNLWQQWRKGEKLDVNAAIAAAEETATGFPGYPYDPTMVAGTGGSGYKDEYDDDGKLIYNPNIHGSETDSEGNKRPLPITGNFFWDSGSEFNFETGPPGQMGYNPQGIIEALEPYNDRELWSRYFNEAYAGNLKGTSGYLNYLQSDEEEEELNPADETGKLSYSRWLARDIQRTLSGIEKVAGEDAGKEAATSLFAYMFSGMHDGELVNIDYGESKLNPQSLYNIVSSSLGAKQINPDWTPEQSPLLRYFDDSTFKKWTGVIAETMPDIARQFGATSGINEKGERVWDEENKKWKGWEWSVLPSFETLMRGYDVRYADINAKSAFGQAYLNDILNVQDDERDKFDKAFTNTNAQLMGGTYDDLRDSIFEDASMARFLNDEGWQEQNEKYQGLVAKHLWKSQLDESIEPEKLYNMSGWEQDTGYYERYINNRSEEAEKLYDNAFELADFLDKTAWLAQGEDFARTLDVSGKVKSEGALAKEIYDRFGLYEGAPEGRRKYSLLQTFNPLLYKAGSDNYQSAETMIKQMALSSTLPVGANPYQRQLHRSMIDQRYDEWVDSNNNPNSFLKYWLESGRIVSTRSSYYEPETEEEKTDPKYYWNKYIQDEFGDGPDPIKRFRSAPSTVTPTPPI